jgi:ribulose kinase
VIDKLTEFEKQFAKNRTLWTKGQWRMVAMTLAGQPIQHIRPGRPIKSKSGQAPALSAVANYQALAHEVLQRMNETGSKQIKQTVKTIMLESWQANRTHVDRYDKRESIVEAKLDTAYDAVRKYLSAWKKADK